MYFLSGLLLTIFLVSVPVSGTEMSDSPLAPFVRAMLRTLSAARKNAPLSSDFAGLMEAVSIQSPVLAENLEKAPRAELLQKMLDGMNSGIRRKDSLLPDKTPAAVPPVRRGKTIYGNRILYLPLYTLTEESCGQLVADCTAAARLAVKPVAAVLDLRHASGGTQQALLRIASVFLDGGYFASQPLAVLTSPRTSGAPELLAAFLERGKNTVTLGEAGRGRLYPEAEVQAAGTVWLVPVIAPEFRDIPPLPHPPMIAFPAGEPVDHTKLGDPDAVRKDAALQTAADLLFSLCALKEQNAQQHPKDKTP